MYALFSTIWPLILIFQNLDKLNLFELYNSVKAVNEKAPHLQLGSTLASLESKYSEALTSNETYLSLTQTKYEPKFLLDPDAPELDLIDEANTEDD